ncbi:hypothetical protein B0H15DRAFT_950574 [Mycena belliarum]|uniref:Uncharacterized protein n=1 Tax=Mycena belliarum TaxID=1033014 RepID=A0AAD6XTQ0_9AGAR|nr:hypothetical protein B0H15DRAFT_950574 [Mycena belliae]
MYDASFGPLLTTTTFHSHLALRRVATSTHRSSPHRRTSESFASTHDVRSAAAALVRDAASRLQPHTAPALPTPPSFATPHPRNSPLVRMHTHTKPMPPPSHSFARSNPRNSAARAVAGLARNAAPTPSRRTRPRRVSSARAATYLLYKVRYVPTSGIAPRPVRSARPHPPQSVIPATDAAPASPAADPARRPADSGATRKPSRPLQGRPARLVRSAPLGHADGPPAKSAPSRVMRRASAHVGGAEPPRWPCPARPRKSASGGAGLPQVSPATPRRPAPRQIRASPAAVLPDVASPSPFDARRAAGRARAPSDALELKVFPRAPPGFLPANDPRAAHAPRLRIRRSLCVRGSLGVVRAAPASRKSRGRLPRRWADPARPRQLPKSRQSRRCASGPERGRGRVLHRRNGGESIPPARDNSQTRAAMLRGSREFPRRARRVLSAGRGHERPGRLERMRPASSASAKTQRRRR